MNERYFVSFHAVSDKTVASQDIARRQQDIPRAFLLLQPYPTCAKSDSIELDSNESTLEIHQNQAETCTKKWANDWLLVLQPLWFHLKALGNLISRAFRADFIAPIHVNIFAGEIPCVCCFKQQTPLGFCVGSSACSHNRGIP